MSNIIKVHNLRKNSGILEFYKNNKLKLKTKAYIGRNGFTNNKQEGDGKTPTGTFKLGIAFGKHEKNEIKYENYIKINENLYWVDDTKSKYYNQLINATKVEKDWTSAEHLIQYPNEYEYAIEIKTNPKNIKGAGSAIFLHCSTEKPTAGCVSIRKKYMKKILEELENNATIIICE